MLAVLIWPDIGHYHVARSRALCEGTSLQVETIEIRSEAGFNRFRAQQSDFTTFPYNGLGLSGRVTVFRVTKPLNRLLEQICPDVVFVPGWSMVEALVALDWCAARGVPAVIMSDSTRVDKTRRLHEEALKRRIVGLAASALVAGQPQATYIQELGVPAEVIFSGYDVVDNDHFTLNADAARRLSEVERKRLGLPRHYLLCCARLVEKKNLLRLIDAYRVYANRAGRELWSLVIVGPGPMEAEIRSLVEAHDLSAFVQLVGAQSYDDMPLFYGLAEALILASTTEQWGLVVNEAMASGLPVLVSRQCGCAMDLVVEARNGFTFDPFDVGAIADAIEKMAAPDCDRLAMGRESRAIIADWGLDRFVAGFEAAAKAAVAQPRRRTGLLDRMLLKALALR